MHRWNRRTGIMILLLAMLISCGRQERKGDEDKIYLLIRCDDIGMCHAVNAAMRQIIDAGIPFSTSVMFACPWYQEAVEILKDAPRVSVGVHLTLNAEWQNYRWGPVTGAGSVPSLVDSTGYFFPSRQTFFDNDPDPVEVERELRAQIERGLHSGLRIDYLDYHMSTAVSSPELMRLVESLAREYKLGISRCFGEIDIASIYSISPEQKTDSLLSYIGGIDSKQVNLAVFHIGLENPEMNALQDLNPRGLKQMSRHRHAELRALLAPEFRQLLESRQVRLITYRELIPMVGLENMEIPGDLAY